MEKTEEQMETWPGEIDVGIQILAHFKLERNVWTSHVRQMGARSVIRHADLALLRQGKGQEYGPQSKTISLWYGLTKGRQTKKRRI